MIRIVISFILSIAFSCGAFFFIKDKQKTKYIKQEEYTYYLSGAIKNDYKYGITLNHQATYGELINLSEPINLSADLSKFKWNEKIPSYITEVIVPYKNQPIHKKNLRDMKSILDWTPIFSKRIAKKICDWIWDSVNNHISYSTLKRGCELTEYQLDKIKRYTYI